MSSQPVSPHRDGHTWLNASQSELVIAQITAIDAWHRTWRSHPEPSPTLTREDKLERARQSDTLAAIRAAMRQQASDHLLGSAAHSTGSPRAVVAVRSDYFVNRLSAALEDYGIKMVARLNNGAEALGVAIAEQPDLLLIEDTMALMRGEDVLREAAQFAPRTLIAIQADQAGRSTALASLGANAVFARALSAEEVAADLAALVVLHSEQRTSLPGES